VQNFNQLYKYLIKENSVINEVGPAAGLLGAAAVVGAPTAAYLTAKSGIIPDEIKSLAKENILYQIFSFFDVTGITSWPYVEIALDEIDKGSEDPLAQKWNYAFLVLSILSSIPVAGLGVRFTYRLITFLPRKVVSYLGNSISRVIGNSPRLKNDKLPEFLAGLYGKKVRNRDLGAVAVDAFEKLGLKVDKNLIIKKAKEKKLPIDPEYIKKITPVKGAMEKLLATLKTAGNVGLKTLQTAGRISRPLAIGGAASAGLSDKASSLLNSIPRTRTSAVYGPKYNLVGKIGSTTPPKY
jgi:hypothetical protein